MQFFAGELDSFDSLIGNYISLTTVELPLIAEAFEFELMRLSAVEYDFPVETNSHVESFVNLYTVKRKEYTEDVLSRGTKYLPMMREVFRKNGLPEDLVYLPIIESAYKVDVTSRAGAKGLWQFMPRTGMMFNLDIDWWVDERVDPLKATEAAAAYLKVLYEMFDDWNIALAAYNAGEGKLQRAIRGAGSSNFWKIAKTNYIRKETKNYVPAAHAAIMIAKYPERYGLEVAGEKPLEFDSVTIPSATELGIIAKCSGAGLTEIKNLNPALKRIVTPDRKDYEIRIPKGSKEYFLASYNQIPAEKRVTWKRHKVRQGETLSRIASLYSTDVDSICRFNSIHNRNRISLGQELIIPLLPNMSPQSVPAKPYKTGEDIVYTVARGDTLYNIARKFSTDIKTISTLNNITEQSEIHPGDTLKIAFGRVSTSGGTEQASGVVAYIVKKGDTLYKIAKLYKTTVNALRAWNGLSHNDSIFPGDQIKIYQE